MISAKSCTPIILITVVYIFCFVFRLVVFAFVGCATIKTSTAQAIAAERQRLFRNSQVWLNSLTTVTLKARLCAFSHNKFRQVCADFHITYVCCAI